MRALVLAGFLVAACGSSPAPSDAGADSSSDADAVVTVVACEVGEPCAVDAGAD